MPALGDSNQITQLRELVAQNPAMIQPLIQQLTAANPQLGRILADNPQALLNFLEGEEGEAGGAGVQVVNITPEEQAAIERVSWERWRKKTDADGNAASSARVPAGGGDRGVSCV